MTVTKGHDAILQLEFFGIAEAEAVLTGNAVGHEGTGSRNGTGKEATILGKDDIRGLGTDVEQHHRLVFLRITGAESIKERGDGAVHSHRAEAVALHLRVEIVKHVFLDGHQERFALAVLAVSQLLIGVDDILHGERNMLLRFHLHLLGDVFHINGRQFDEAHEHLLPGDNIPHIASLYLQLCHHLSDGIAHIVHTHTLLDRVEENIPAGVARKRKATSGRSEDSHGDALRAYFQGHRCLIFSHKYLFFC